MLPQRTNALSAAAKTRHQYDAAARKDVLDRPHGHVQRHFVASNAVVRAEKGLHKYQPKSVAGIESGPRQNLRAAVTVRPAER